MAKFKLNVSLLVVLLFCVYGCSCENTCQYRTYQYQGDINFAVILSLREAELNGSCGRVSYSALQLSTAVKYVVEKLNTPDSQGNTFIPGVKIGFTVYDDCGYDKYASSSALQMIQPDFPPDIITCTQTAPSLFTGFIGPSRSQSAMAVSKILDGTELPSIGIATTLSDLSNKTKYPNFLRTTVSDSEQAKAIVTLMETLKWSTVAIFQSTDQYSKDLGATIRRLADQRQICVSYVETVKDLRQLDLAIVKLLSTQKTTKDNSLGILVLSQRELARDFVQKLASLYSGGNQDVSRLQVIFPDSIGKNKETLDFSGTTSVKNFISAIWSVSPTSIPMRTFGEYLNSEISQSRSNGNSSNPWMSSFVQTMCQSPFVNPSCTLFQQSGYLTATIHAVYALMTAAKQHHNTTCAGASGICPALANEISTNLLERVRSVSVSYSDLNREHTIAEFADSKVKVLFDQRGDIALGSHDIIYTINKYTDGDFKEAGSYYKNGTLSLTTASEIPSQCGAECQPCLRETSFVYMPGDILLAGFFSVHWAPETKEPFGCGTFRNSVQTVIAVESFWYAIKKMRNETGQSIGGVIFDDCYNSLKAGSFVAKYFSGDEELIDPVTNEKIDLRKVVGVIGTESSAVTIPLAESFAKLGIPVVSPASTSPDYDDKTMHPYTLRTVMSDKDTVSSIFAILKHFNWKYASVVYSRNIYGIKGAALLKQKAKEEGVCMVEPIPIDVTPEEKQVFEILKTLSENRAKVVIYFGLEEDIKMFQRVLKSNPIKVVFLGLEDWAVNGKPYPGTDKQTAGSLLVLPINPPLPWDDLPQYLVNLKPVWSETSLWFDRFWQKHFQCNLPGRFENNYSKMCDDSLKFSLTDANEWANHFRVGNTINAVTSVIKGVLFASQSVCLNGEFACATYRENPAKVTKIIKEVKLGAAQFRPYRDDGNGNLDFGIQNLQDVGGGRFQYVQVGTYYGAKGTFEKHPDSNIQFYLGDKMVDHINSSCQPPANCEYCEDKKPVIPAQQNVVNSECTCDAIQVTTLVFVCLLVVLLLCVLGFIIFRKLKRSYKEEEIRSDDHIKNGLIGNGHVQNVEAYRAPFPIFENQADNYNSAYASEENENESRSFTPHAVPRAGEDIYLHPAPAFTSPSSQSPALITEPTVIPSGQTVPKTVDGSLEQTIPKQIGEENSNGERRYSTLPHLDNQTPSTPENGDVKSNGEDIQQILIGDGSESPVRIEVKQERLPPPLPARLTTRRKDEGETVI